MSSEDEYDEELVALGSPGAPQVVDSSSSATLHGRVADEVAECSRADKKAECRLAVLAALDGEITSLDLTEMGLNTLPPSFERMRPAVAKLDLSLNQLAELPPPVLTLTNLVELQLFGNALGALPDALGALGALRRLLAVQNRLARLPATIGKLLSLEVLDVEENLLTELPSELACLPQLRVLRASGNPLPCPPPAVVKLGVEAVRDALRSRDAGEGAG